MWGNKYVVAGDIIGHTSSSWPAIKYGNVFPT